MKQDAPFLRWAGSKRQVLHRIRAFWSPGFGRYIEPFAGSASLFFDLQPQAAILGDVNGELINTLQCVRNAPEVVHKQMEGWRRSKRRYYSLRKTEPATLPLAMRAARFIYLNRFCFNGIYRTNRAGKFNVPYARAKTGKLPTLEYLQRCAEVLKRAEIHQADFETLLVEKAEKNDFVYLDPPYATDHKRIFREYASQDFSTRDIPRLVALLDQIHTRGCLFVLSYAHCREALQAFSRWRVTSHYVQRNVSGFAKSRRRAKEVLVTNIA